MEDEFWGMFCRLSEISYRPISISATTLSLWKSRIGGQTSSTYNNWQWTFLSYCVVHAICKSLYIGTYFPVFVLSQETLFVSNI